MLTSPSGKAYIGQTIKTLKQRLGGHCSTSSCPALSAAIKKYGIENFRAEILLEVNTEQLDYYEVKFINMYGTRAPRGYNLAPGGRVARGEDNPMSGRVGPLNPNYGNVYGEETRQKLRNARANRNGVFHPFFGKKHSESTRAKLSQSLKGRFAGQASIMWGKHGPDHPATGQTFTEEQKANLRKPKSKEWKMRMSEIRRQLPSFIFKKQRVGRYEYVTGELLEVFESQSAAARAIGAAPACISNVITGKQKTCKGFVWKKRKYPPTCKTRTYTS